MNVKRVANELDVSPDTVRYYTRIGLVEPRRNKNNGYKDYSITDIDRLRFILAARALGFSCQDIGIVIGEAVKGRTPCPLVRELIVSHLEETEKRYKETVALRNRMKKQFLCGRRNPIKCHLEQWFVT